MHTRNGSATLLKPGASAAVIGALAAVLTVSPAHADDAGRAPARAGADSAMAPAFRHAGGAALAAPPRASSAPAVQASTWTVQPGDTVAAIAARHGLRTADVLAWNGLGWQSVIHPGQVLRLGPGAASAAPAPPAASGTHTVVAGDTVYAIAQRYGTSVAAVIAANGLGNAAIIHPGQKLQIPAIPTTPVSATAAPAPTPAPPVTPAAPVPAPATPPAGASAAAHTVVAGDTLFGIARTYRTSVAALLAANGIGEGGIIYPGQVLRLSPVLSTGQRAAALDAEQTANAAHIVRVGRELGIPDRGIAIALATAMVESSMRNLDHGDRDSLGLFQQRPSQGWGTPAQIMDADRSIRAFFGGPHGPNARTAPGLLDVPGWEAMAFTDAAQAVQISAYPDRYGQWEQQAHRWLAGL